MKSRFVSWAARCARGAAVVVSLLAALAASGATPRSDNWQQWSVEFEEDKKPWKEIGSKIPPYPRPENLVPLDGGSASPHRFFIDAQSLSVGEDGVVRYTLLVRTAGGSTNVSFEGMRCETREQKYYALGRADGSWVRARDSQWRRLVTQSVNRHHDVLYADVLCPGKSPITTTREALQRLKSSSPTFE